MAVFPGGPQDGVKYTMTAPDGSVAVFNDATDPNYVGQASFSGLDSPDVREAIDPRSGTDGSVQGLNFRGSRPVIGTVEILASSTTERNQKSQRLKRACNALRRDGTLDFLPDGGVASRVYFRLNGPVRRSDASGWLYTFQFPLMSADPYIYSSTQRTGSGTTAAVTLTNQGDGLAAPTFTVVTGTGTGVVIKLANQTTGQSVQLLSTFNPASFTATFTRTFGTPGNGTGEFTYAMGTAVDSSGNIFVTDYGNNRVQKFNSSGVYQSSFGTTGSGTGQFSGPTGISIDSSNNIFVADGGNTRIQKFNSSGVYQSTVGSGGTGNGQFGPYIYGLAHDSSNNLFVADYWNGRIQKFNSAGTYQAQVAISSPFGVAVDASNNVYATSTFASVTPLVRKYSNALSFTSGFGTYGSGDGQFQAAYGVAVDGSGNIYVVDAVRNDIQKFNSSFVYLTKFGSYGSGNGQFATPALPAWNAAKSHLYVPEIAGGRVTDFAIGNTATISFDMANAAVTVAGLNVYQYLDVPNSQWWNLDPGDNSILVSGAASWSAAWRDAWL